MRGHVLCSPLLSNRLLIKGCLHFRRYACSFLHGSGPLGGSLLRLCSSLLLGDDPGCLIHLLLPSSDARLLLVRRLLCSFPTFGLLGSSVLGKHARSLHFLGEPRSFRRNVLVIGSLLRRPCCCRLLRDGTCSLNLLGHASS